MLTLVLVHPFLHLHMKREGNTRLALLLPTIVVLLGSCGLSLLLAVYDTLHGAPVAHIHFLMSYPLSIITNRPQVARTETNERLTTHKNGSTLGKRQGNCGDDERTPKQPRRGRGNTYHPETHQCNPCALWQQSGSDQNLLHLHPQQDMRHASNNPRSIENYACWDGTTFQLDHDSCICEPCHRDCRRNYGNRENTMPRWAKKRYEYYNTSTIRHCLLCCEQDGEHGHCLCPQIAQWGPDQWNGLDTESTWKKFYVYRAILIPL